jgi:hypothetical protein
MATFYSPDIPCRKFELSIRNSPETKPAKRSNVGRIEEGANGLRHILAALTPAAG